MKKLNKTAALVIAGMSLMTVSAIHANASAPKVGRQIHTEVISNILHQHKTLSPHVDNHFNFNNKKQSSPSARQAIREMPQFIIQRSHDRYTNIGGNTRDLGGYKTVNGKYQVKHDRIIRSASLHWLSESKQDDISKLHVNYIIDLRNNGGKQGITSEPDPNENDGKYLGKTNAKYVVNPVYTNSGEKVFGPSIKKYGEIAYYGWPAVSSKQAIKSYRTTFKVLLSNKSGATMYHCSLGRDRTGTTSALILSALDIPKTTIYNDYLLTDHYQYHYSKKGHKPYPIQAKELTKFFKTIDTKYGSVSNYLHNVIGLNNSQITQLRHEYLSKTKTDSKVHAVHHSKRIHHNKLQEYKYNKPQDHKRYASKNKKHAKRNSLIMHLKPVMHLRKLIKNI